MAHLYAMQDDFQAKRKLVVAGSFRKCFGSRCDFLVSGTEC